MNKFRFFCLAIGLLMIVSTAGCATIFGDDDVTPTPARLPTTTGGLAAATAIATATPEATQTAVAIPSPTGTLGVNVLDGCSQAVVLYEHDGADRSKGWKLEITRSNEYLRPPFFGGASEIYVPRGCRVVIHDLAPLGSGGHGRLIEGPRTLNLQKAERNPLPNDSGGTCEDQLQYCWSDHVVAIEVYSGQVAEVRPTGTLRPHPTASKTSVPAKRLCVQPVVLYKHNDSTPGWTVPFNGEQYGRASAKGFPDYDGSALLIPPNCKVVVYDQHSGGGHEVTLTNTGTGPLFIDLETVGRAPLQWEIDQKKSDHCKNDLVYCWSDHTVDAVAYTIQ